MNSDQNTPITSGSLDVWVRSSFLAKLTDLMIFGGKKAVLSWDVAQKTVSLQEVENSSAATNPMFIAHTSQITAAYFPPGKNFFITVNGTAYDLSLRNSYTNSAVITDAIEIIDGGVEGAYSESKSNLFVLRAFLKQEHPDKIYVSKASARQNQLVALVIIAFIIIIAVIVGSTS